MCGEQGDGGCVKGENRKSGRSQMVKGLESEATEIPLGDSKVVYRSPQPAHHHCLPPSQNELRLWGHPSLH